MNESLRRLRDAIAPTREVEVDPTGTVRDVPPTPPPDEEHGPAEPPRPKATKLSPRTFGR